MNRCAPARILVAAGLVAAGLMPPSPAVGAPDSVFVHCTVYHDLDGDGVRQAGEPGLPDVFLTNGLEVVPTDASGVRELWVDREIYRFATVSVPKGWWPTSPFYHHVPVGHAGPDTVEFGLEVRTETTVDPVRWAHITDTHANTTGIPPDYSQALDEINELTPPPVAVFNTGDLVERGDIDPYWQTYVEQADVSVAPLLNVPGNHDIERAPTLPLDNYEEYAGPPYYSLDMGSWHFVIWNSEPGSPRQHEWLAADMATATPGSWSALLMHRMTAVQPDSTIALWNALGIEHVFSGHWHCSEIVRRHTGITDYNLSWTVYGPVDRTPKGFGLVSCNADGTVHYDLRRLRVDHRSFLVWPKENFLVRDGTLTVLVQAYDTSSPVSWVSGTLTATGVGSVPVPMLSEGVSLWRGTAPIDSFPEGPATISVTGAFEDGTPLSEEVSFRINVSPRPPSSLGGDWPMFRRCAAGSSFTTDHLRPPLEIRWVASTPGMVALASPVVAGGKVIFGVRAESHPDDAGVGAWDAMTGQPLWYTTIPSGIALAPAVVDDVVLVNAMADSVYGLDLATGARRWGTHKYAMQYDLTAPIFDGDDAWVGAKPRCVQFRWDNGVVRWASERLGTPFYPYIYGAPAVNADRVFLGGFAHDYFPGDISLAALDRVDGAVDVWETNGAYRSPILGDDELFVVGGSSGSTYNPVQSLVRRTLDGATTWSASQVLTKETASPALGHGVLVTSGKPTGQPGSVFAFSATDGQPLWSFPVGGPLYDMVLGMKGGKSTSSSPAIADSVVWVGGLDGHLYALDLFSGTTLSAFFLGTPIASSPAISGDFLFVGASDGHLYAFAAASPETSTAVGELPHAALRLTLLPPRPNPGTGEVTIAWVQPASGQVAVRLYGLAGDLVCTLVNRHLDPGRHSVQWDGRNRNGERTASGVYFAVLEAGGEKRHRKIVRLAQ